MTTLIVAKTAWLSRPTGPLSWTSLRRLTESKAAQHVFVFLFVTPFLAGILESLAAGGSASTLRINGPTIPLNWTLYFFSACAYLVGQVVFTLRCPSLLRDYPDFGAYLTSRRPLPFVWVYFDHLPRRLQCHVADTLRIDDSAWPDEGPDGTVLFRQMKRPNETHAAAVVFHELFMASDRAHLFSRLLVAIASATGLALFAIVLLHNMYVAGCFYLHNGF